MQQEIGKKLRFLRISSILVLIAGIQTVSIAQKQVLDRIVAVVGNNIILHSDIETQKMQALQQGFSMDEKMDCIILEDLLFQKLLLHQAELDSITVEDGQVEGELDRRLGYFIAQLGSKEKLEEFYGKTLLLIKEEMRELLRDQLKSQSMQSKITEDVKATPSDVKTYFENLNEDSIPLISSQVEVAHIVKRPKVSEEEKDRVKEKLKNYKSQIEKNEISFESLAVLYSEDGSSKNGGELGYMNRAELVPEFAAVAFKLSPGEISDVVETEFGFHIIQPIDRRGEQVNVRHILIKPEIPASAMQEAKAFLDSIHTLILNDSITFEKQHVSTRKMITQKIAHGSIINPATGDTRFDMDKLDPQLFFTIDKMSKGKVSESVFVQDRNGKGYRLLKLVERTDPHRANLKEDYQIVQNAALADLQNKALMKWLNNQLKDTYIEVQEDLQSCNFESAWIKKK